MSDEKIWWYQAITPRCDSSQINQYHCLFNKDSGIIYSDSDIKFQKDNDVYTNIRRLQKYGQNDPVYFRVPLLLDKNNETLRDRINYVLNNLSNSEDKIYFFNNLYEGGDVDKWATQSGWQLKGIKYCILDYSDISYITGDYLFYDNKEEKWIAFPNFRIIGPAGSTGFEWDKKKPDPIIPWFDYDPWTKTRKFLVNETEEFPFGAYDPDSCKEALQSAITYAKNKSYALPKHNDTKIIAFYSQNSDGTVDFLETEYVTIDSISPSSLKEIRCGHYNCIEDIQDIYQKATYLEYTKPEDITYSEMLNLISQVVEKIKLPIPISFDSSSEGKMAFKYNKTKGKWEKTTPISVSTT